MSNYVRESVLVDTTSDSPFIRLYKYKDIFFDAGFCAAYFGFAKKSRNLFIYNLHKENGVPLNEALDISHDFYDNFSDMQYVKMRARQVYHDNIRCPKCSAMYVEYDRDAWFFKYKCCACNLKW